MKRSLSIEALIRKARQGHQDLRAAYEASLHERYVREDLKVEIKNIFENLRSCLDYMAHEIYEVFCGQNPPPSHLYFPIRQNEVDFDMAIGNYFPNLVTVAPRIVAFLKSIQPFRDPWLRNFNQLNNHNKHQDLVPQTRTEVKQVSVTTPGGGSISWGSGVHFGGGVSVLGVPIDPRTQLPIPNKQVETKIMIWVDFKFKDIDESVLPFIDDSIQKVESIYSELQKCWPLAVSCR